MSYSGDNVHFSIFKKTINMSNPVTRQIFREAASFDEFEAMLRLRFEVFSEKGEIFLIEPSGFANGLDVNGYDLCSTHFGFYEKTVGIVGQRLLGTVRFIDAAVNPRSENWIRQLLKKYPDLSWEVLKVPGVPLLQDATQNSQIEKSTADLFKKYRSNGAKLFEVSRLAMKNEARGHGNGQKAIESAWAFVVRNESTAMFGPDRDHKPMYQPYFTYPLALAGNFDWGATTKSIVYGDIHCLHPLKRPQIEKMAAALRQTGQVVFTLTGRILWSRRRRKRSVDFQF